MGRHRGIIQIEPEKTSMAAKPQLWKPANAPADEKPKPITHDAQLKSWIDEGKPGERRRQYIAPGLFVEQSETGAVLWRFRYRKNGTDHKLSFGEYPAVKLSEAQAKRKAAMTSLAAGSGPAADRAAVKAKAKADIEADKAAKAKATTFNDLVTMWQTYEAALLERKRKAPATVPKDAWALNYLVEQIGTKPIIEIHRRPSYERWMPSRLSQIPPRHHHARRSKPASSLTTQSAARTLQPATRPAIYANTTTHRRPRTAQHCTTLQTLASCCAGSMCMTPNTVETALCGWRCSCCRWSSLGRVS